MGRNISHFFYICVMRKGVNVLDLDHAQNTFSLIIYTKYYAPSAPLTSFLYKIRGLSGADSGAEYGFWGGILRPTPDLGRMGRIILHNF